jgi:hypothetical protein
MYIVTLKEYNGPYVKSESCPCAFIRHEIGLSESFGLMVDTKELQLMDKVKQYILCNLEQIGRQRVKESKVTCKILTV